MTTEEKKRIKSLSLEESRAEMLDTMSDALRDFARKIAMMKAIAKHENDIAPEDFDKALNRELGKAWNKVKDLDSDQLAMMGLMELMLAGEDISILLVEGED